MMYSIILDYYLYVLFISKNDIFIEVFIIRVLLCRYILLSLLDF